MSFRVERGQIIPIPSSKAAKENPNIDFQKILQETTNKNDSVKISFHAEQRMAERNIKLQESDMKLINQAMNNLEKKGARESLMIYKDMAFIASVNNRTLITALQTREIDVITNIDSAIIVK